VRALKDQELGLTQTTASVVEEAPAEPALQIA
jgi:hypothetical protein